MTPPNVSFSISPQYPSGTIQSLVFTEDFNVLLALTMPQFGESITQARIVHWLKKEGDFVKLDEVIAEVESDKATFELPAEATGILHIVAKENETLPIGGLICKIELTDAAPVGEAAAKQEAVAAPASGGGDKSYAAGHPSPAAAKRTSSTTSSPAPTKARCSFRNRANWRAESGGSPFIIVRRAR